MIRLVEVETSKPYVSLCFIFWIPLHGDHGTPCQVILLRSSIWALLVHLYPGALSSSKSLVTGVSARLLWTNHHPFSCHCNIPASLENQARKRPIQAHIARGLAPRTLGVLVCVCVCAANPMIWLTSGPPLNDEVDAWCMPLSIAWKEPVVAICQQFFV